MQEREIAEQVIQKNLRIGDGEFVLIDAWEHTLPLAEALAGACLRAGALPIVTFFTDALYRTVLTDIPNTVLRRPSRPMLAAYDHITAAIWLGGPKDPAIFEGAAPEKMAAMHEAEKPLWDKGRERKIRGAWMALSFATPERARQYGVDHQAWIGSINDALTVDPTELGSVGARLAAILHDGRQLKVTASGTDLTLNLASRPAQVRDGIVDEQDLAAGNRFVDLPAGSVAVAPDEDSADGVVTFPVAGLWGETIRDLTWTFSKGRLVSFSAREHESAFRRLWDSASGDKDRVGSLTFGINPRAGVVGGGNLTDHIVEGAVSVALGANKDLGGSLESSFDWAGTLTGARVEVDGRVIAENGRVLV